MANGQRGRRRKDVKPSIASSAFSLSIDSVLGGQSDRVTEYVVTKTTSSSRALEDEFDEGGGEGDSDVKEAEEKKTRAPKKRKTTTRATTAVSKLAAHRVTVPISELVENNACSFQGNMPDPDNCQCKKE